MRWNDIKHEPCSVARTLSIIGDRWTLLIIRNAFLGITRFDDFQKQLDVTRHLLADRLDLLVEHQVLRKVPYQTKPERFEYKLTEKGVELFPIIMTLVAWGDKWESDGAGPPIKYYDKTSGKEIQPALVDKQTGQPINPRHTRPAVGPGIKPYLNDPDFINRWETLLKRNKIID